MDVEQRQSGTLVEAHVGGEPARAPAREETYLSDLDTQLMLQYCAGQAEAANALVRRNIDRVTRFVARVVRDARVVEDLVQDVFLRVITRAEKYVPTARFSTWLYRIATHVALNHLREIGARRRSQGPSITDIEVSDAAQPLPDQALSLDELRRGLAAVLDELPPNQRIALVLCDSEDLSYRQIAAILSVSVEAVRALLLRARTTVRRRLATLL